MERRKMATMFGKTSWVPKGGKGKILVDSSLRGLPALSTLVHEMAHHLHWGLSEKRVLHLEYALVNLVLSNPEVFKALAGQAARRRRRR